MIYRLRHTLFTLGHKFTIENAAGHEVYQVEGPFFLPGNSLSLRDMAGNELASIEQKLLSLGHTYEVSREGQVEAVIKEAFFQPFRHRFTVDEEQPNDLIAQGDLFNREYTFTRSDQTVATVSHRLFSIPNIYGIEIADGEDEVLILCCAVVINLVHQRQHHH
jgi:uncharacterized protein YxjI